MGDVVHSLSALERARALWPEAELWWVVERLAAPLLEGHPALDGVVVLERKEATRSAQALRRGLAGIRRLRGLRFDLALDLQGLLRSALVARASGARRVWGPSWAREGGRLLYHEGLQVPRPGEAHAVERYLRLVEAAQARLGGAAPLERGDLLPRLPEGLRAPRSERPRLVLLPGAGKPANRLPPALLAELADACRASCEDLEVWALGGPDDAERARALRAAAASPIETRCSGDLAGAARLLASAWAVVGGDTGPLHLARALGVPTLGLFNAADPARTGPGGIPGAAWVSALPGQAACAPCLAKRCLRSDQRRVCLEGYRAEVLAEELRPHLRC